jgi:predicted RNA-binding Zn ribbon-like protein
MRVLAIMLTSYYYFEGYTTTRHGFGQAVMSADEKESSSRAATLALVGRELALDLTNTTSGRGGPHRIEHLRTADDIAVWACHAKIITEENSKDLRRKLRHSKPLAQELRQSTLALRDAVYEIGIALAAGGRARSADVDRLTRIHAHCVRFAHLKRHEGAYVWTWNFAVQPVQAILGPITFSAIGLLCQTDLSRVKQCPGADCGWLFLDRTKNNGRRWCEMEVCGNRAKQRRLRQRRGRRRYPNAELRTPRRRLKVARRNDTPTRARRVEP